MFLPEELLVERQIDSEREQPGLAPQEYWIMAYRINLGSCRKRTIKVRVRMVLVENDSSRRKLDMILGTLNDQENGMEKLD